MHESQLTAWPGEPALVGLRLEGREIHEVFRTGPVGAQRSWASVSKTIAGIQFAQEWEKNHDVGQSPAGPEGSTLAHLLSHSSGLGFEEDAPRSAVGTRRVYSNIGIDQAVATMSRVDPSGDWAAKIFSPLNIVAHLAGRPSSGVVGTCQDLAVLAGEWLLPSLMSSAARAEVTKVFLPELSGVVPGYGRFDPCPWGLGVEIRGQKEHWMGDWPAESFGHFGQSGSLLLANLDEGIAVVATSSVDFGPWAKDYWPQLISAIRQELLEA